MVEVQKITEYYDSTLVALDWTLTTQHMSSYCDGDMSVRNILKNNLLLYSAWDHNL